MKKQYGVVLVYILFKICFYFNKIKQLKYENAV